MRAVDARGVSIVVVEIIEERSHFGFGDVPESSIEARTKAIRPRACIDIHFMEGIKNFLIGERVIKVSELWNWSGVEILKREGPRRGRGIS